MGPDLLNGPQYKLGLKVWQDDEGPSKAQGGGQIHGLAPWSRSVHKGLKKNGRSDDLRRRK